MITLYLNIISVLRLSLPCLYDFSGGHFIIFSNINYKFEILLLIVGALGSDESTLSGGVGATISALISEKCYYDLDRPVCRYSNVDWVKLCRRSY